MTNQTKLSRREAIKLLGTVAGASVLAHLPSKWSKPRVTGNALPAHAQTSSSLEIFDCDFTLNIVTGEWSSTPYVVSTVGPPLPLPYSFPMKFTFTFDNTYFTLSGVHPLYTNPWSNTKNINPATGEVDDVDQSNTVHTDGTMAYIVATAGSVTVRWEFDSPFYGTNFCEKTAYWND